MTKVKTIKLSFPHWDDTKDGLDRINSPHVYRVEQVTNSVEFAPGQQLSKKQADELCDSHAWSVTMVPVKP